MTRKKPDANKPFRSAYPLSAIRYPVRSLERNIVVEFLFAGRCGRAIFHRCRTGCTGFAASAATATTTAACGATASAQHLHIAGYDLSGVPVLAFLILPLA